MAAQDLVLGYDFGTSSVKAALFNRDGVPLAQAQARYPLYCPAPGWVEQKPDDWWRAMAEATAALLQQADASRIAALVISAQMCGVVPADARGETLCDALIWMDTRSAALARTFAGGPVRLSGYGPLKLARWLWLTGGAPNLAGKDAISKILWLRQERPDIWSRTRKIMDVKDWLVHRCTGRFATSFDCAHLSWLFDRRKKRWSPALLRQAGLSAELFPEVLRATDMAGGLTPEAAASLGLPSGLPVAVGMGDVAAATAGAGTPQNGNLHLYLGTSAWLAASLSVPKLDTNTNIGSILDANGQDHLLIATQENAGAALEWGIGALGFGEGGFPALEQEAAMATPRAEGPLFFPWLAGERVPVSDEHLRGGFANLAVGDARPDLALALFEGVAQNLRWAMDSFDRLSGKRGQTLRAIGGGARSPFWCQLFADILERGMQRTENPELCGALGSAMAGAVAAGWYADMQAAAVMVKPGSAVAPDPARRALYRGRQKKFASYYRNLRRWRQT